MAGFLKLGETWLSAPVFHNLLWLETVSCRVSGLFVQISIWTGSKFPCNLKVLNFAFLGFVQHYNHYIGREERKHNHVRCTFFEPWYSITHWTSQGNGKREYVLYYNSIIFALKCQKMLGMSQDQHRPALRDSVRGAAEESGRRAGT